MHIWIWVSALSTKTCSRTLPLFCTGEAFLPLDAMNAGYYLKTLCLRYEGYVPLFRVAFFFIICAFSSQCYCFLLPTKEHWQPFPNVCFPNFIWTFLPLYLNFSLCVCVLFWGFFWSMHIQAPSELEAILAVCRFLPDNWFSCLKDSHIVNEGTDLPGPCMMFLFPGELPCCLMKLVYFRILAGNTSKLLECIWKRKKLNFCDRVITKFDN